ncbi:hypothetical protein V7S43_009755 [Phytophthora oleae]|uniref:Uncharacterized protein n=1 Tax=Phytophthora oleae TaxID=2107226 RepID=A0ABD3FED1_9STRA
MALALRCVGLLDYIKEKRGIPTHPAYERMVEQEDGFSDSYMDMNHMMYTITCGEVVLSTDKARTRSGRAAVEFLTRFGFLYEDENEQLQFPSSMHMKIWLYSKRPDPLQKVLNFSQDDFVAACIKRMWAGALQRYATANTCNSTRERQMQMELYDATVPCLPRNVLVTPGCRTNDGKGCNDLVIRGSSIFWLWKLLVNEDDDFAPTKRFETLGKSYGRFTGSFKYVLIDFRQNKRIGHEKDGFLYVPFEDSYKKALISGLGKPVTTVELSGR